jgi:hypothetical protein
MDPRAPVTLFQYRNISCVIADSVAIYIGDLDLLYIAVSTPYMPDPSSIRRNLEACVAWSRVRSIAMPGVWTINNYTRYLHEFRLCPNLELVFAVFKGCRNGEYHNEDCTLSAFCFEDMEVDVDDWYRTKVDKYKTEMQLFMARDEGGITPFVREVLHIEELEEII